MKNRISRQAVANSTFCCAARCFSPTLAGLLFLAIANLGCTSVTVRVHNLFDGQTLEGWEVVPNQHSDTWLVAGSVALNAEHEEKRLSVTEGRGILVNGTTGRTPNLKSVQEFGDCNVHIEFYCPRDANSGVYLMGMYELQIRERSHKDVPELQMRDCGGIFARRVDGKYVDGSPPLVKAMRGPGEWQSFDIEFEAPRFDSSGEKITNARLVKVLLNGKRVQKDLELRGPTGGHLPGPERATGPILLQGDHGAVAFRNIWVQTRH
jgi:hypothetical protein